jgi:hypothetical protein
MGACLVQERGGGGRRIADKDVGSQGDQLPGEALRLVGAGRREATVDADVAAFRPAEMLELLPERREAGLGLRIVLGVADEHPDPPHLAWLLRARRERPKKKRRRDRRAPDKRDELAPSDIGHGFTPRP